MDDSQRGVEMCFELLQSGDADGLPEFCNKTPPRPRRATQPA